MGHTLAGYPLKPCATGLSGQRFAIFLMVFWMTIFSTIPKTKQLALYFCSIGFTPVEAIYFM
jgi:hypothetical protein